MLKKNSKKFIASAALSAMTVGTSLAQGITGITTAGSELTQYIDPVADLCLVVGAVVGIIGGVRVYIKWNSGDNDINKEIMGWGGSCLFLVLSAVIVKSFFGL